MDFFKSVFAEETDNSDSEDTPISPSNSEPQPQSESPPGVPDADPNIPAIANAWSFGSGLLKTLASKSESVIQNYRRDLEDFSSGLQKETAIIREAASRAVKDLPAHIESGATVAQESLETVGQAIDNIGTSVADIIAQGKDSILAHEDSDNEFSDRSDDIYKPNLNVKPYSRIDALIRAIQCDAKTYCEEPEDSEDYNEWKLGFVFEEKLVEIGELVEENIVIGEIYSEIVPSKIDRETFWSRYFYKVHKVNKAEEARMRLVKRAISGEDEEELSWDVDDDNDNGSGDVLRKTVEKTENLQVVDKQKNSETAEEDHTSDSEAKTINVVDEKEDSEHRNGDDKGTSEAKNDNNSDFSVVSSQPSSREDEDLGWDEIEDTGSDNESKMTGKVNPNRADLHKRISVGDEDEELTWDIEDDDDDVPSKP